MTDDTLSLDDLPQPIEETTVSPDDLSVDGDNPNEQSDDVFDLLCDRIKQRGWIGAPIVADADGVIADGEHRWRAAQELGLDEIPVRYYDFSDGERRMVRQELNKIQGNHDTKRDALEYDLLLNSGLADEVHDLTSSIGEDLDELLAEIKVENQRHPEYEYDTDHNVHFRDCVEGMATLDDNSVDCVITDPPYGIDFQSRWNDPDGHFDTLDNDDYDDALATYDAAMAELERVLKPTGHLYTFTRWDVFPDFLERTARDTITVKNCLVWYKKRGGLGNLDGDYARDHEFIIFATGDDPRDLNADTRPRNVLRYNTPHVEDYDHPTQKPVPLIEDILTNSTTPGDTVLDPFMGSGATAVAAIQTNRDYIGYEIDDDYRPVIERRIGEATRQREASVNADAPEAATDGGDTR